MRESKKRLDIRLTEEYPSVSRSEAHSWIMRGAVTVDGLVVTKSGTPVKPSSAIQLILPTERFVSRAGYKLEAALSHYNISVAGKIALDAGISTGGFSHCLLKRDISKIYGIDVGYGQVHEHVKSDPRLIIMEKTNLRHVESLPDLIDIATLDLSFISLTKIIPVIKKLMHPAGEIIALIKPQFEAGYTEVSRGKGIIKSPHIHASVIANITEAMSCSQFFVEGVIESPILGGSGNKEFLLYARSIQ